MLGVSFSSDVILIGADSYGERSLGPVGWTLVHPDRLTIPAQFEIRIDRFAARRAFPGRARLFVGMRLRAVVFPLGQKLSGLVGIAAVDPQRAPLQVGRRLH